MVAVGYLFVAQIGLGGDYGLSMLTVAPLVLVICGEPREGGTGMGPRKMRGIYISVERGGAMGQEGFFIYYLLHPHNYISLIFDDIKKYLLQ